MLLLLELDESDFVDDESDVVAFVSVFVSLVDSFASLGFELDEDPARLSVL